jgi:hypothetical protein
MTRAFVLLSIAVVGCTRRTPKIEPASTVSSSAIVSVADAREEVDATTDGDLNIRAQDTNEPFDTAGPAKWSIPCKPGGQVSYWMARAERVKPTMHFKWPEVYIPDRCAAREIHAQMEAHIRDVTKEYADGLCSPIPAGPNVPAPLQSCGPGDYDCEPTLVSPEAVSVFCAGYEDYGSGRYLYALFTWRIADGHAIAVQFDDIFSHDKRPAFRAWFVADVGRQKGYPPDPNPSIDNAESGDGFDIQVDHMLDEFTIDRDGIGFHAANRMMGGAGDEYAVKLSWTDAHKFGKADGLLSELEAAATSPQSCGNSFHRVCEKL